MKRQTGIHKDDKHKIKVLLRHFVLDLFKHQRQDLSDDERDEDEEDDKEDEKEDAAASDKEDKDKNGGGGSKATRAERARKKKDDDGQKAAGGGGAGSKKGGKKEKENTVTEADVKAELSKGGSNGRRTPLHARDMEGDESYSHIMCNNHWYIFFRLHHILCERLTKMYNQSLIIRAEETRDRGHRKESTAVALRLKPKSECHCMDRLGAIPSLPHLRSLSHLIKTFRRTRGLAVVDDEQGQVFLSRLKYLTRLRT